MTSAWVCGTVKVGDDHLFANPVVDRALRYSRELRRSRGLVASARESQCVAQLLTLVTPQCVPNSCPVPSRLWADGR